MKQCSLGNFMESIKDPCEITDCDREANPIKEKHVHFQIDQEKKLLLPVSAV